MKRINNLHATICSIENLYQADQVARKGKSRQPGVIEHMKCQDENIDRLHWMLIDQTYKTSPYTTFPIFEPKERLIFRLPYYPDRIVHHAIMRVLEPIFMSMFTADTYSCIKKRGVHAAAVKVKNALQDVTGTTYCLKLDIKKFYPSVDHTILMAQLKHKFKDRQLLQLLEGIVNSAEGLPIGNYLSQYLANFYMTGFDHWIKEVKHIRYYFRYADDIVVLASTKAELHQLLADIRNYLHNNLHLQVKGNYQVFPVAARGIDFIGYKFYHRYTLLRKRIKNRFRRAVAKGKPRPTIAAYYGWSKHCNSTNLLQKLIPDFHNENIFRNGHRAHIKTVHRRQSFTEQDSE